MTAGRTRAAREAAPEGNGGIGLATAVQLAEQGSHVFVVGASFFVDGGENQT